MPRVRFAGAVAAGLTALAATGTVVPAQAQPARTLSPGVSVLTVSKIVGNMADGNACTVGFLGQRPDGSRVGIYAGHCGNTGQEVSADGVVIGKVVASSSPPLTAQRTFADPKAADWAYFSVDPAAVTLTQGAQKPATVAHAGVGDPVCAYGAKSGKRCGTVTAVNGDYVSTTIPAHVGDSGGALIRTSDGAGVGIASRSMAFGGGDSTGSMYYDLATALNTAGLALVVG